MNAEPLGSLPKGSHFRILGLQVNKEIGKRLADMGFTRGTEGTLVRKALLGDPIQVEILGYQVSLRKSEALGVSVEVLEKLS